MLMLTACGGIHQKLKINCPDFFLKKKGAYNTHSPAIIPGPPCPQHSPAFIPGLPCLQYMLTCQHFQPALPTTHTHLPLFLIHPTLPTITLTCYDSWLPRTQHTITGHSSWLACSQNPLTWYYSLLFRPQLLPPHVPPSWCCSPHHCRLTWSPHQCPSHPHYCLCGAQIAPVPPVCHLLHSGPEKYVIS